MAASCEGWMLIFLLASQLSIEQHLASQLAIYLRSVHILDSCFSACQLAINPLKNFTIFSFCKLAIVIAIARCCTATTVLLVAMERTIVVAVRLLTLLYEPSSCLGLDMVENVGLKGCAFVAWSALLIATYASGCSKIVFEYF